MFLGEYTHTIDDKGRLTIPAKFRGQLANGLVVTRGFEKNLMIFTMSGWESLAQRITAKPFANEEVRILRRRLFSGAADLEPDRQGRIVIPAYLREFASIDSEVVVNGMFDHIEIWSIGNWHEMRETMENSDDAARWDALDI